MDDVFAFADESGTSKGTPCYTIGLVALPKNYFVEFNERIEEIYCKRSI